MLNPRSIVDGKNVTLFFTPSETCTGEISIERYGYDYSEIIPFTGNSSKGEVTANGTVRLELNKDERVSLKTSLNEDNLKSLKIVANKLNDGGKRNEI